MVRRDKVKGRRSIGTLKNSKTGVNLHEQIQYNLHEKTRTSIRVCQILQIKKGDRKLKNIFVYIHLELRPRLPQLVEAAD